MAASGTTKKITSNQILGAGGTATLASATITGDLTVRTTGLTVNSSGVGVGTSSQSSFLGNSPKKLVIGDGTQTPALTLYGGTANVSGIYYAKGTVGNEAYRGFIEYNHAVDALTVGISGTTAMTLNSTGLGVGGSPANFANYTTIHAIGKTTTAGGVFQTSTSNNSTAARFACSSTAVDLFVETSHPIDFYTNATKRMTLDATGNVGIGGNASATGIDTGVARLFVVAPNSNTGMAATFIADSVGRGLLVADQGKTNSFGVEVVAGLVKTGGFTSGTSVALFANAVERARVKSTGQVRFVPLAADPSGAEAGDVYYNSSSNKLKCYNGSTWNDLF